jgi:hypothetical protein
MASNTYSLATPPVFTGVNYQMWAVRMKTYLQACDLWDAVEQEHEPQPLSADPTIAQIRNNREERSRKFKAKTCLYAAVSEAIFPRIIAFDTGKQIWNYLKEEFHGNERTIQMQVLNLRREFEMQKMKDSETIRDFSDRLLSIVNKIRLLGEELSDQRVVEKILVTLPERFESKISSLEEAKDLSKISLGELLNALQAQEQRRTIRQEESMEGAFPAKVQVKESDKGKRKNIKYKGAGSSNRRVGTFPPCQHCKKTNHSQNYCWWRPDVKCRKCNQLGHMEKICKNRTNQQHEEAQVANQQQEEQLFVATCFVSKHASDCWLIDSGCTNHMTNDVNLFKHLDKSSVSKVRIGNGEYIPVKGKGTVAIEGNSGIKLISDVLFVPEIDQNLLSVGQLLEKGYSVVFKNKHCLISDPTGLEIFTIKMQGKSFSLDWMEEETAAVSNTTNEADLWHKRMGHFNQAALVHMQRRKMVRGVPSLEEKITVCVSCQYGKQHRLGFPQNKAWRASEKLQLIHTDVAGPQMTDSLNGSRYYVAFIDDYTRMCWVYFLKSKAEVAGVFLRFKNWVENQSGHKIQIVRSDNGTEYTSNKFAQFCHDAGIEHQYTTPYTPQQNGVSERKNRTIMEMARCLLFEKDLPKKFWAEAVNTAVFLLNRLPTRALQHKTPYEVWHGYKPSLQNLKVFGCLCFTHIPQVKRDKLDRKAEAGIFVGYSNVTKGYRVYQPATEKIIISRDIKFVEAEKWNFEDTTSNASKEIMQDFDEDVDDTPVRGTRLLADIYQSFNVAVLEPAEYEEAKNDPRWVTTMKEELSMIEKNQTWELVDMPTHKQPIGVKWVYRTKLNADGTINKHKARIVVKGYAQVFGVDFSETYAPVARLDTIRMLLAIAAHKGWKIFQLDVKSAFLNGYLQEEIYVEQPKGFMVEGEEDKVYLLKKALYGLKQAPRAWYSRIDEHLLKHGFNKSLSESTLYIKSSNTGLMAVSLYVDDLFVTGNNSTMIDIFKAEMMEVFEMTDLGEMSYFLGMEVQQNQLGIFVGQQKYAKEILKKFKMEDCKSMTTPMNLKEKFSKEDGADKVDEAIYRSLIGCLMYLTATRPDIMHAVSLLSRFMHCASEIHFKAAKRVVRYIKGTLNYGIKFSCAENFELQGYADSDWAGSCDDMKSTSGYCFSFGSGIFSWCSKKQEVIAQSTAEAEYVAATAAANQVLWLRKILADLDMEQREATKVNVDNQAAIAISNNPIFHGKTKHFKLKYYFLREVQKNEELQLIYCKTEDQLADILTKPLPKARFETLRNKIGVCSKRCKEEC